MEVNLLGQSLALPSASLLTQPNNLLNMPILSSGIGLKKI